MKDIKLIYNKLYSHFGKQGWWPIVNDDTLFEYYNDGPRNEFEALEICFGAILTQGTQWYPNVVRSLQQLKLGREFTKKELELIRKAEVLQREIFRKNEKISQNKTWKNVEKAIINLNKNNLIDIDKIIKINNKKLAKIIKSSGYHNQKAKKLKNFCLYINKHYNNKINEFFNNDIVELRDELLSINGIGPETADSMILYAAKKPIFVVDAYTKRIYSRIFTKELKYEELQQIFTKELNNDEKLFNEYHALLVELGKNICKTKPICDRCPINTMCDYYKNGV